MLSAKRMLCCKKYKRRGATFAEKEKYTIQALIPQWQLFTTKMYVKMYNALFMTHDEIQHQK